MPSFGAKRRPSAFTHPPARTAATYSGHPGRIRWATLCLAGFATTASAQDLEPRAYANTPIGMNFLVAGFSHMWGGLTVDPSIPLKNAKLEIEGAFLAYAHSLPVFGQSGKVDVVLPTAWLSGSAEFAGQSRERDIAGLADPKFRFSANLYGAPALTLDEFPQYEQDVIVGASLQITAPGGQYDPNKLVNLGANRWSFKTELGVSKRFGDLTLEVAGEGIFYTDNSQFLGGHTRSQDPIYGVQAHVIYSFPYHIWGSLDATWYGGGEASIDDGPFRDLQEFTRVGATLALPVSRQHSIKLYGSTGVSARTGAYFDQVGIAWQYRFGGGL